MKLAPRMIQSMEILQMASVALEERIEQELSNNPTLELYEQPADEEEQAKREIEQEQRDAQEGERELVISDDTTDMSHAADFERLANISEEYGEAWKSNTYETAAPPRQKARNTGERDAKLDAMANTAARGRSLADQLLDDWHLLDTVPGVRRAGEYLIELIDDDGYIRLPWDQVHSQAPRDVITSLLDETLELLQKSLEPVGLGARDVRECLLLQIPDTQAMATERAIVSDYLPDIEANRLPKIAKALKIDIEQVKQALLGLKAFHIHPGRMLVSTPTQVIRPDAIVQYDEQADCYVAFLCHGRVPAVQINYQYEQLGADKTTDRKTREFVNNNLRSARWLIDAIEQRSHTLLRVINVVLESQRDFFDMGPQALKPLPMTLVADQLGIHVATVSRAVSEKFIQSPRGIFPLRMFFSGGTETDAGESMSWTAVQAKLQEIIDAEDKAKPFNDDELVAQLKEAGIEIARRTVAKYRKQLHIPPARQRREF